MTMRVFSKESRDKAWNSVYGPLPRGVVEFKKKVEYILE